jgi:tRNA (guanine-N7-)-methyltransferase
LGDPVVTGEIEIALAFLQDRARTEIEIGSGNGHFLAAYGERHRTTVLLGIETKSKRCAKIEKKITAAGLSRVMVFRGRAEELTQRLEPGSIDAFHVYFPDPWPKTKHRRRRLMRWPSLSLLHRALKKDGTVYFGSDVFDYYLQVKVLALFHGGFAVGIESLPPEVVLSLFSEKTSGAGKKIHALAIHKKE